MLNINKIKVSFLSIFLLVFLQKNENFNSNYPIYEFMSSKLTNLHTHKIIEGCIFGYNKKPSFGEMIFNFTKDEPTATYTAYSIDDENVGSVEIKLKELQTNDNLIPND
jgi:alkaline phosphatase D